ncbi:MAG: hypothetical protein QXN87_04800 [Candidatus Bathyarchaeia archaeon]
MQPRRMLYRLEPLSLKLPTPMLMPSLLRLVQVVETARFPWLVEAI